MISLCPVLSLFYLFQPDQQLPTTETDQAEDDLRVTIPELCQWAPSRIPFCSSSIPFGHLRVCVSVCGCKWERSERKVVDLRESSQWNYGFKEIILFLFESQFVFNLGSKPSDWYKQPWEFSVSEIWGQVSKTDY